MADIDFGYEREPRRDQDGVAYDPGTGAVPMPSFDTHTQPVPLGGSTGSSGGGGSIDDYLKQLEAEARRHGATPEAGWRADLERTYQGVGGQGGRSAEDVFQSLMAQQKARGASTNHRMSDSQGVQFSNTSPQFSDPAANLLENYALDRFNQRMNPNAQSGTGLHEQYLRELSETLKKPVYSAGDEAVIKTRVTDVLEREREQTKQRWLEQVSRMGHDPKSGPVLEGLRRIDEHFNQQRTKVDADFAHRAITDTRQQRLQVADVLGNLAGSEEGRMSDAVNYARIPLALQDRSFNMGLSLVNAGGSPTQLVNNALSFLDRASQQQQISNQQRQQFLDGLFRYLGYSFGG